MPAPVLATVAFEIDFHDDLTDIDVTGDVYDYWIRTGTEYVPEAQGDLRIEGARGRIRLLNRDNQYDRRRYGSSYTEAELSRPHRFRMRINGDSVCYAFVEPPQHIDQSQDELVEFRIFSANDSRWNDEYYYQVTENQTAVKFLDDLVSSMGTRKHSRSVITAISMGAIEVRSTYRKALDDYAKFIGGYVIEHSSGDIVAISALETNNTNPRVIDTTFSYISLDGYRDIQDLSKVRNNGKIEHIGIGGSTKTTSSNAHKYRGGEKVVSVGPSASEGATSTKTASYLLPEGVNNARNPAVWYKWAWHISSSVHGQGFSAQTRSTTTTGTVRHDTASDRYYYDISYEIVWNSGGGTGEAAYSYAQAVPTFDYYTEVSEVVPATQKQNYYRNEESIATYGDRELTLPPWFSDATASSPAGTHIAKWIDALSEPISFRQVEMPFAQPTQASSNLLRDLRAGDICHVIVEDIDQHQLANHRMLLLGLEYRGGTNRLGIARLGLIDIPYQQTAGQFILDQSELDGQDTLG